MPYQRICPVCSKEFTTKDKRNASCSRVCGDLHQRNNPAKFWTLVDIRGDNECWNWKGYIGFAGYGQYTYHREVWTTHRLSYFLHFGSIPTDKHILHSCNNRLCCNWHHLRPGTNQENQADRVKFGIVTKGELNPRAKFTSSQILEIRELYRTGKYFQKDLAEKYDTTQQYISDIINKRRWKHI